MLTPFDDFPVHQTALPLAHTGNGNPHQYDRFWFNGFREDLMLGVAFCGYPNRQIMDGAFSVVHEGVQRSVFVSGRSNADPTDTRMGPLRVEIIEPMRVNRVVVDALDQGLVADLTYTAVTTVVEESRQTRYNGATVNMDATRATQWGRWTGRLQVDGRDIDLGADGIAATKDRSWGVRNASGLTDGGAPPVGGSGTLFLWAPIHFEDECFHFLVFENPDGTRWAQDSFSVPKVAQGEPPPGIGGSYVSFPRVDHDIDWIPGTRRVASARFTTHTSNGTEDVMHLEPLMTFQMKGIGYGHPQWAHSRWQGELVVGGESFNEDSLDRLALENIHVQQLVRARWRGKVGLGVLEQVLIGPNERYGFTDLFGGAPDTRIPQQRRQR